MFRVLIFALCCFVSSISVRANPQQNVPANQAFVPQSTDSEKDLFNKAEKSDKAGDWENAYQAFKLAFEKRKGKEHKKYTPLFTAVKARLADAEVAKGQDALSRNDLETCERQLQRAKNYAITVNVESLEKSFNAKKADLQQQFDRAVSLAKASDYEKAAAILKTLLPFEKYVPGVGAEIARQDRLHTDYLVQGGWDHCANRRWKEAADSFQKALAREPANTRAREGVQRVDRGSKADFAAAKAREYFNKESFSDALSSIDSAIQIDPESKDIMLPTKNQIMERWTRSLEEKLPPLLTEPRDFTKSRDALYILETLRDLKQDHPMVAEHMSAVASNYGNNAWEGADQLSQREDMSRVATSYALLLSAKERLEQGTIRPEKIKELASGFNRKRAAQVVVSVENLCGAPEKFVDAIRTRAMSSIEKLGLPDLRVRTLKEYTAAPDEDTQFQELRPDGKSYTMLLTVEIQRHQSERNRKEARSEKSTYLERIEEVQNPEWLKKREDVSREIEQIQGKKSKVPERERPDRIRQLQWELDQIPKTITRPLIKSYEYQVLEYAQGAEVKLAIRIKDRLANTLILAGEEIKQDKSEIGREISGVHSADQNGLQNLPLRMTSPEEALSRAELEVGESLGTRLPDLLTSFAQRFLQEGKQRLQRNQPDEAVEYLLCHWAFVRGVMNNADAAMIRNLVRQETGFDLNRYQQEFFSLVNPVHTAR